MKRHTAYFILYSLLLPALALSGWYFGKSTNEAKLDRHTLRHSADIVIQDLNFYEFDEQGQLARYIQSHRVEHTPFRNQFTLTHPRVLFQNEDKQPWHLSANQADTTKGFKHIVFKGDVILNQHDDGTHHEMAMYTQELTYLPQQARAFTHSPVLFKQQGQSLESEGMHANLKKNKIRLNHAHAQIEPSHA